MEPISFDNEINFGNFQSTQKAQAGGCKGVCVGFGCASHGLQFSQIAKKQAKTGDTISFSGNKPV